jgi:hypothetical protein
MTIGLSEPKCNHLRIRIKTNLRMQKILSIRRFVKKFVFVDVKLIDDLIIRTITNLKMKYEE